MPYHKTIQYAVGLLFVALVITGCSTASDVVSPTSDFWDRRPTVAGRRQQAPRTAPPRAAPREREFVQRQAPPARRSEPESFPAPQPRIATPTPTPAPRQMQQPRRSYPAPPPRATPRATTTQTHAPASVAEMRVLEQVNRIRTQHHLRTLRFHATLWVAARDHSREQDRHGYMGHGSPDPARRELSQRMALAGYHGRVYAEVVAWGYPSVASVVEGWMNSPEHRRILLDPELTEAGFSRVGQYWTGNFGAPSRFARSATPRPLAPRRPTTTFRRAPTPPAATFRRAPATTYRRAPAPTYRPAPAPTPRPVAKPRPQSAPVPRAVPKAKPKPAPKTFTLPQPQGFG